MTRENLHIVDRVFQLRNGGKRSIQLDERILKIRGQGHVLQRVQARDAD